MLLNHGESVVLQAVVEREGDGRGGTLTLTTTRLVFEAEQMQGLVSRALSGPRTVIAFEAALTAIRDVQAQRKFVGRPVLHVQSYQGIQRFKTSEAESWVVAIGRTRAAVPPMAPAPMYGHQPYGAPVVVNVHAAQPLPPPPPQAPSVYLHCRMCGTLSAAGTVRCASCGAAL